MNRVHEFVGADGLLQHAREHHTAAASFAEIDRLASQMVRTGAPSDSVELTVVNGAAHCVLADRVLHTFFVNVVDEEDA